MLFQEFFASSLKHCHLGSYLYPSILPKSLEKLLQSLAFPLKSNTKQSTSLQGTPLPTLLVLNKLLETDCNWVSNKSSSISQAERPDEWNRRLYRTGRGGWYTRWVCWSQRDLDKLRKWAERNLAMFNGKWKVLLPGRNNLRHHCRLGVNYLKSSTADNPGGLGCLG